jgi:hypothetical protein
MKQDVNPGIMAAIIILVVLVVGYFGWKSMSSKGSGVGTSSSPYSNYKGPIPGQNGAGSGGPGRGGPGSGGPGSGGMQSGGSGGAPATGG